jgi:filamentous hemagglutinin family protein
VATAFFVVVNMVQRASRPLAKLLLASVSAMALSVSGAAAQAPEGGKVVSGAASVSRAGDRTTVRQTSQRAVVDWRGFDVGREHTVAFDQPGRDSATLNRVTSGRESVIAGRVQAPGTVIIQNNAGVIFSGDARVDVGSLVATSQSVDAARFQRDGRLSIGGGEAGLAALVGGDVRNAGAIVAEKGVAALASGERTTIDFGGDGLVRIAVDGDPEGGSFVENTGSIDAAGGRVLISAGAASRLVDRAINLDGLVTAAAIDGDGGSVEIVGRSGGAVRLAGTVDASGARGRGGAVSVRAEDVVATAASRIDARGASGGSATVVARRNARVDGAIAAGGPGGGGFVETSGFVALAVGGSASVDVGAGGAWLLDPRDVTLGWTGSGPSFVSLVPVVGALNAGGDVTVTTATPGGTDPGDLTVAQSFVWTGPGDLFLVADRDVVVNGVVRSLGAGDLSLTAGRDITTNAILNVEGTGDLSLTAGRSIDIGANIRADGSGDVSLVSLGGDIVANRDFTGNVSVEAAQGDVSIEARGGSVLFQNQSTSGFDFWVRAPQGAITIEAADRFVLEASDAPDGRTWLGSYGQGSDISVSARTVDVIGKSLDNSPTAIVTAGEGGSIEIEASERITLGDGVHRGSQIIASEGASLTMQAPRQFWYGRVRSTGLPYARDGGDVLLSGEIVVDYWLGPSFNLRDGRSFRLAETAPDGTPSSYTANNDLQIYTGGTGTIEIEAPVSAKHVWMVSEEGVGLTPTGSVEGTGAVNPVIIAAGRRFRNDAGPDAVSASDPDGRWLIYVDTFDGYEGDQIAGRDFDLYGRDFEGGWPLSYEGVWPGGFLGEAPLPGIGGDRVVYAERPTLTVSADDAAKRYGETPALSVSVTGARPSDPTAALFAAGSPSADSAGAAADAPVGLYAVTASATLSDRAVLQGYDLVFAPGALTVTPAPLTVTTQDASRTYGAANPDFAATFSGFVLGEDAGDLGGALAFRTDATERSGVGVYAVTPEGLTSANYAISFAPGALTVTPAPLTVAADDAARGFGQPNPPFSAQFSGFVLGEGPQDLDGTLVFATQAGVTSPAGQYEIAVQGLMSGNYDISFVPGILTVAPPPPAPRVSLDVVERSFPGAPPLTVGDASFRTTVAEAPEAAADAFALAYSLGVVVQQAPTGFAPAGVEAGAGCGGPVNVGAVDETCEEIAVRESYWTTRAETAE